MNDSERQFLLAVERGDLSTVKELLNKRDQLNLDINCSDLLARDALIIAIDNENLDIIKLLLEARIEIGDALLYAVDESFVEAVELLLEHQHKYSIPARQWHEDSYYSADMTPLILAAHRNNFEIIKMLLDHNVQPIPDPHDPRCDCAPCCRARQDDCLKHSQSRINAYRALVSPCLMALSSSDPLLAAFKMSEKLENLARMEPEYKQDYLRLRTQCQNFATQLMDHTRTSKELEILLNYSDDTALLLEAKEQCCHSYDEQGIPMNMMQDDRIKKYTIQKQNHTDRLPKLLTISCMQSNNTELSSMNEFMETDTEKRRRRRMIKSLRADSRRQRTSATTKEHQLIDSVSGKHEMYDSSNRLARLKLAIQCKQKTFCAHPNVQELLAAMWYENLPGFRRKNFLAQMFQVIGIGLMFPIYSVAYLIAPHTNFGSYIKKPFIKFICHSASYITFLIVLILASQRVEAFYSWSSVLELISSLSTSHNQQNYYAGTESNFSNIWEHPDNKDNTNLDNLNVEKLTAMYKHIDGTTSSGARSLDNLSKIFGELPASSKKRGTMPCPIETMILVWVFSLIWAEIKQIKLLGLNYYKHDMWNILDSVASGFYVGAIILRVVSYLQADERTLEVAREHWDAYDPTLLSEGLFATATIFSALKLVYIFSLNPYLGPLQISLGRMIIDILRFSWIYLLVLFAFACGMNQLLWYYADLERHQCLNITNYSLAQYYSGLKVSALPVASTNSSNNSSSSSSANFSASNDLDNFNEERLSATSSTDDDSKPPVTIDDSCKTWRHFSNVFESSQTLFWANFGLVDLENFELTGIRQYTRFWALLMFGCYCFINVIVVLNLLIAMMNHSYVKISKRSDVEWKFARTRLWMSYFDTGSTVPAPFNIVPSIKSVKHFILWLLKRCLCCRSKQTRCQRVHNLLAKQNCLRQSYREVIRSLVRRYLVQEQRILEKKRELTEAKLQRWAKWGREGKLDQ